MNKIIPTLWFDGRAEEAAKYYAGIFPDSSTGKITHYTEIGQDQHQQEPGSVMTVEFTICGMPFIGLNGGPIFKFTPAVSFIASFSSPDEVTRTWEAFSEGGTPLMPLDSYPFSDRYGWIQDKFGLSWQLIYTPEVTEPSITPALMFTGANAGKAEEAMNFYTSVFKDAAINTINRYTADNTPEVEGTVMYADFTLEGQAFAAMDSAQAHNFTFTEAVSFLVNCTTQDEIDNYWDKLSAVPESEQCGWLKDKYGVSWQIVPAQLDDLLENSDKDKSDRVMEAMMNMKKLNIEELENA